MKNGLKRNDKLGLVKPSIDAHTLGLSALENLLRQCGFQVCMAGPDVCDAVEEPQKPDALPRMGRWLKENQITHLGFSYRLDPMKAANLFGAMMEMLNQNGFLSHKGGPVRELLFAGLPEACRRVKAAFPDVEVFWGDETTGETLDKLGIETFHRPAGLSREIQYDKMRWSFASDLIRAEKHNRIAPQRPASYPNFGTRKDGLIPRLYYYQKKARGPVIRAHAGPYFENRTEAIRVFQTWAAALAQTGFLDILSIGTSQLTQSEFGGQWNGKPNGGGVPINSASEYAAIYEASRPLLVRTYAGTRDIENLARMHEETINIAWHALSFWWFCRLDGRGPYDLRENLSQHIRTLRYAAQTGKPVEPNVPHHFSFRGGDDVTYIVSAYLAAKTVKLNGVRHLVLQNMLNTPKATSGLNDLAKSRALLALVRDLVDDNFQIVLQPRAGLDYLSPDLTKARIQLAAATAVMDDIEPADDTSPSIVHVVGYSEASHLADPPVINESIQITLAALQEYRALRQKGELMDTLENENVRLRTMHLRNAARLMIRTIESTIPNAYTADGLHSIFQAGFLPVPYLWLDRDEFPHAVRWNTGLRNGGVDVIDGNGQPVQYEKIAAEAAEMYRSRPGAGPSEKRKISTCAE